MDDLRKLVEPAFTELERRLQQRMITDFLRALSQQPEYHVRFPSVEPQDVQRLSVVYQTMRFIEASEERKEQLDARFQALTDRLALTYIDEEKQKLMLDFLESIDFDKKRLKGDRKAFKRYMGFDVISERYRKFILHEEILQKLAIDVIGSLTAKTLERNTGDRARDVEISSYILSTFQLQRFLLDRTRRTRRWQNKVAAFAALGKIIRAIPESEKLQMLGFDTVRFITQYCLDVSENIWIQIGALRLLSELSRNECVRAFGVRLLENENDISDNLFVRKAILQLIGEGFVDSYGFGILRKLVDRKDESEYVRIQLMKTLALFPSAEARRLLKGFANGNFDEDCAQVRAQAVIEWTNLGKTAAETSDEALLKESVEMLTWAITDGNDLFVQRIALEEAAQLCNCREEILNKGQVDALDKRILDAISEVLSGEGFDVKLKRWAGEAWEQITVKTLPEYKMLSQTLLPKIDELREGESTIISRSYLSEDENCLGRVLSFLSRESFGLYVEMGQKQVKLVRGDRWKRTLWRLLHELRNLSPDKRQAFSHLVARKPVGTIRAHPGMLAELTRTKVPGERLYIEYEGSWRRFIPLLDDYLSLSRRKFAGREVKLFSSCGITTIQSPKSWFSNARNYLKISWNYARIASLRNANPVDREHVDPKVYIDTMREKYGIITHFSPYSYHYDGTEHYFRDETIEGLFREEE